MGEAQSREKTDEERSVYMYMLIIYNIHTSACMKQAVFFHSNVDIEIHIHSSTCCHCLLCNLQIYLGHLHWMCTWCTQHVHAIGTHMDYPALNTAFDYHNCSNRLRHRTLLVAVGSHMKNKQKSNTTKSLPFSSNSDSLSQVLTQQYSISASRNYIYSLQREVCLTGAEFSH